MSNQSEKHFRLFSFLATCSDEPEKLLRTKLNEEELNKQADKQKQEATKFMMKFLSLKVEAVFNSEKELYFEFCRGPHETGVSGDDEKWSSDCDIAA